MTTILHVSDLHFGPHYMPAVADALHRFARQLEPNLIIASGDFTQRAKPEQFQQARAYLDSLPQVETIVVPGNHDVPLYRVWERMARPYQWYRRYIRDELDYVVRAGECDIAALNTSTPYRSVVNGVFHSAQLELCERFFEATPADHLRIVVAHHPLLAPADYKRGAIVHNAREAAIKFSQLRVDLLFSGHLHRSYVASVRDVCMECLTTYPTLIVHCGTTTSGRGRAGERERNSLNVVHVHRDHFQVVRYHYCRDTDSFRRTSDHYYPRGGAWMA